MLVAPKDPMHLDHHPTIYCHPNYLLPQHSGFGIENPTNLDKPLVFFQLSFLWENVFFEFPNGVGCQIRFRFHKDLDSS